MFDSRRYVPFRYTHACNKAGEAYLVRGVVAGDIAGLALAIGWLMPNPFLGALGLLLMHFGLWCVYELGYVENDRFAIRYERGGSVRTAHEEYASHMAPELAWACGALLSGLGLMLCVGAGARPEIDAGSFAALLALWLGYLGAMRLVFRFYNVTEPDSRYPLYGILQVARFAGYLLLFAISAVGAALIAALIVGRWFPYLVYRLGGTRWSGGIKLLTFVSLLVMLPFAFAAEPSVDALLQALAAVGWFAVRARREIQAYLASWTTLRRDEDADEEEVSESSL